ncbi:MAG TPA: hypothetical protein VNH11_32200 [Pirellulales bacterium]|nr:hypothetical protein [Pirellulales bacterium]
MSDLRSAETGAKQKHRKPVAGEDERCAKTSVKEEREKYFYKPTLMRSAVAASHGGVAACDPKSARTFSFLHKHFYN